jgi:hypothetical protein
MKYAMLICGDEENWFNADEAEIRATMDEIYTWMEKWEKAGKIAPGGAELDHSGKARTVSRGADGQPVVTDGPYLELKEIIGGVIMLEADDIDEAVAVAAGWPGIARYAEKVEVRPVISR